MLRHQYSSTASSSAVAASTAALRCRRRQQQQQQRRTRHVAAAARGDESDDRIQLSPEEAAAYEALSQEKSESQEMSLACCFMQSPWLH